MSEKAKSAVRQGVLAVVAVTLLAAAGWLATSRRGERVASRPVTSERVYLYDVSRGELIVAEPELMPPSPTLLLAHVYGCGVCGEAATLIVGHVEKGNPAFEPGGAAAPILVADVATMHWQERTDAAVAGYEDAVRRRCGEQAMVRCAAP